MRELEVQENQQQTEHYQELAEGGDVKSDKLSWTFPLFLYLCVYYLLICFYISIFKKYKKKQKD